MKTLRSSIPLLVAVLTALFCMNSLSAPEESADATKPLGKGEPVPAAKLKTAKGDAFALKEQIKNKPTILIFYRGGWCPFCTKHLAELQESQQDLLDMGYQILAITADAPEQMPATSKEHELDYTLLSDVGMEASDAFGLAFYLDEETSKRYEGRFDMSAKHEGRYWLPVPAVYVVGKDGKIAFAHTDTNYRKRLPVKDLLVAAKKASK
ncbi:peroxiredoxin-like family protein [Haloferula sp.]|uniref:peroxiredoxin-like family protein n=1 Tax=Haloferula sp. TaxID=2497595 RepID=UPI0032A086EE